MTTVVTYVVILVVTSFLYGAGPGRRFVRPMQCRVPDRRFTGGRPSSPVWNDIEPYGAAPVAGRVLVDISERLPI